MRSMALSFHAATIHSVAQLMEMLRGQGYDTEQPIVLRTHEGQYVVEQEDPSEAEAPAEAPQAGPEATHAGPTQQPADVPPGTPFSPSEEGQHRVPEPPPAEEA